MITRRFLPALALAVLPATGCGTESPAAPADAAPPGGAAAPSPAPPDGGPGAPAAPECPESGVRVTPGMVEAAMGLRVLDIQLTNCGTQPYRLEGHPHLVLLGADREPVGVEPVEGSAGIAVVEGFDDAPRPLTLAPGESASAGLLWRNTVAETGAPVVAEHAEVTPAPGTPAQEITPDGGIDLGTTGLAGVGPWRTADAR
ncbi:DUF4232 domain-containing protein [Streptomyces marincola]|uniref:DUF4232 domain-containing protein n=1 Tax=Streptomyces marincola TaxID=2878388 RepID=A0A1W7D6Q9_9ACTN|nr:DUF4232 domain-containing protein [Streptomyces marincola]ARQ72300.1 hypothetical protein CAG99_11810 [Streptomyces marincola]